VVRLLVFLLSFLTPPPSLESCIAYWQQQLNLQDWTVTLRVVGQDELDPGTLGDIEPNLAAKTAVLRVMRTSDSDLSRRRARAEQRLTIVHEMVHLRRFADQDPGWGTEFATNARAGALVREHRRWFEQLAIER
jgi:hypothetical protein